MHIFSIEFLSMLNVLSATKSFKRIYFNKSSELSLACILVMMCFFPMYLWCMHVYVVWTFHNNVTNIIDFLSCINLKTLKNMLDSVKLLSAWNEMPSLATFSHGVLRHSGVTTKTLPKCIICMNCRFQWIYLYTFDFLWVIPLENEKRLISVWFSSNDYRCRLGLNQMAFLVYNFV